MEKNDVKVSVMVLAYNHEKYIRQALESIVMQQTNFEFEVIIGEDMSTDNTRVIIKEFQQRYPEIIKPIFRKKNLGACRNVVSTLRRCTGEYVAFFEYDDYWVDPLKLQKQVDYLECHPECSGVMTNVRVVNRYGNAMVTGPKVLDCELKNEMDFVKTMYPYNQFKFIGCFMTRNYYKDGRYDKYLLQAEYVADIIVQAITQCKGKIGFIDEILSAYRWVPSHGNNFSALKKEVLCKDKIKAIRVLLHLFSGKAYLRIYMRICREHWNLIYGYIGEKKYLELVKYILFHMPLIEKLFYIMYYVRRKSTGVF